MYCDFNRYDLIGIILMIVTIVMCIWVTSIMETYNKNNGYDENDRNDDK